MAELFEEGKIAPEYCKEALRREVRWNNNALSKEILDAEGRGTLTLPPNMTIPDATNADLPKVTQLFKVIDANTVTVVISPKLQEQLLRGQWCGQDQLQKHSVQIWGWRAEDLRLEEFPRFPGLYRWSFEYDGFLGYMTGLLPIIEVASGKPAII